MNTLNIKRYNGTESYELGFVSMEFINLEGHIMLHLEVESSNALTTLEDTVKLHALPTASILIPVKSADATLLDNANFSLPISYDPVLEKELATFYYAEHQDLNANTLVIKHLEKGIYKVDWFAETTDVNFYDKSKSNAQIHIEAEALLNV